MYFGESNEYAGKWEIHEISSDWSGLSGAILLTQATAVVINYIHCVPWNSLCTHSLFSTVGSLTRYSIWGMDEFCVDMIGYHDQAECWLANRR